MIFYGKPTNRIPLFLQFDQALSRWQGGWAVDRSIISFAAAKDPNRAGEVK
jgi:hypothetical protein